MEIRPEQRRRGRGVWWLVNAACVLFTLVGCLFLVPSVMGMQRYVITGTSMTGTIDRGSVVFEEVVPVNDLEVGDVITYTPPPGSGIDYPITHRIVAHDGDTFRTRGDAVPQRDPWHFHLDDSVQARVKYTVPYVGYLFIALTDRGLRMLVIGVPAALLGLFSLWQILSILRRDDTDEETDDAPALDHDANGRREPVGAGS